MALDNNIIKEKLKAKFGDVNGIQSINHSNAEVPNTPTVGDETNHSDKDIIKGYEESYGMLSVTIAAPQNLKVLQFLYDDETLAFTFLTDLTAVHFPDRKDEELCVVYHLHNFWNNTRMRVKLFVPVEKPDVFTLTRLFSGANWMERETYDYFGVNFVGHPNLTRILNVDEMDYFPMRKEYPMEDSSRRDKDDEMFGRGGIGDQ